jgi:hypothetical protein
MPTKFRPGDRVKWVGNGGITYYGEITIDREDDSKVIFDSIKGDCEAWFPDYDYYPNSELELIEDEDDN